MDNFKKDTFIKATKLLGLLLIPCFLAAYEEDEGNRGNNVIWVMFSKLFYVLRFPTHTLLWKFICEHGAIIYFAGLVINCCFYGFITEKILYLINSQLLRRNFTKF